MNLRARQPVLQSFPIRILKLDLIRALNRLRGHDVAERARRAYDKACRKQCRSRGIDVRLARIRKLREQLQWRRCSAEQPFDVYRKEPATDGLEPRPDLRCGP